MTNAGIIYLGFGLIAMNNEL